MCSSLKWKQRVCPLLLFGGFVITATSHKNKRWQNYAAAVAAAYAKLLLSRVRPEMDPEYPNLTNKCNVGFSELADNQSWLPGRVSSSDEPVPKRRRIHGLTAESP
ncbi:hypothetical protein ETB97_000515 [Aspergillus alliaceus]|uniref:Uncharacterized protein n=1 Tax=Petromyces alliaceus TaxID=209559 RepID=A0A8H6A419_PETAA|nr:hypothetical protein ETB97_000515 [Aspergillus burnettii]